MLPCTSGLQSSRMSRSQPFIGFQVAAKDPQTHSIRPCLIPRWSVSACGLAFMVSF